MSCVVVDCIGSSVAFRIVPYMGRVEFRWPDELVARIDGAADGRPRSVWVRMVVEKALGGSGASADVRRSPASSRRSSVVGSDGAAGKNPSVASSRRSPESKQERIGKAKRIVEGEETPLPAIAPRRWAS